MIEGIINLDTEYLLLKAEEYGEHSCALTDPEGCMYPIDTTAKGILRLVSAYQVVMVNGY